MTADTQKRWRLRTYALCGVSIGLVIKLANQHGAGLEAIYAFRDGEYLPAAEFAFGLLAVLLICAGMGVMIGLIRRLYLD